MPTTAKAAAKGKKRKNPPSSAAPGKVKSAKNAAASKIPAKYVFKDQPTPPLNAYKLFVQDQQRPLAEAAQAWKNRSNAVSNNYLERERADQARYDSEMATWNDKFAARRHALVVGQSAYTTFSQLPRVRNDAAMVAGLLQRMGWYVVTATDLSSRAEIEAAISHFIEGTHQPGKEASDVLIYYSGHGASRLHRSTKQPLSILFGKDGSEYELDADALRRQIDADRGGHSPTFGIILDACRDHKAEKVPTDNQPSVAVPFVSNGFMAFACKPNTSASAGAGATDYSLFTEHLIAYLDKQIDINKLFRQVCADVYTASAKKYEPWYSESIKTPTYSLHPSPSADTAASSVISPAASTIPASSPSHATSVTPKSPTASAAASVQ
jgi:hypothetical protein